MKPAKPPVKVITLERSAERRVEFGRRNSHLTHDFVTAVDGSTLSPEAVKQTGLFAAGLTYTSGAVGNALSHHRLWQEVIESGQPLTVAEDDAVFRKDFAILHQEPARRFRDRTL